MHGRRIIFREHPVIMLVSNKCKFLISIPSHNFNLAVSHNHVLTRHIRHSRPVRCTLLLLRFTLLYKENKEQRRCLTCGCLPHVNGSCTTISPSCHVASSYWSEMKCTKKQFPDSFAYAANDGGVMPEVVSATMSGDAFLAESCATSGASSPAVFTLPLFSTGFCADCSLQSTLVRRHEAQSPFVCPA